MDSLDDYIIRKETIDDYYETECLVREAFWNKYMPGADEHYYVTQIRSSPDYLPEISRIVTTKDTKKIIGAIYYTKSWLINELAQSTDIITFGPLCVHPDYQRKKIGTKLLNYTMNLGKEQGYNAIVIFGEPTYYPRFGFKTCDNFNITTSTGENFEAFMAYELKPDFLKNFKGYYNHSKVFEEITQSDIDAFDKKYPIKEKVNKPDHWKKLKE